MFELDHSSDHNAECPNGLSVNSIILGRGGKQRMMRDVLFTDKDIGSIVHARLLKSDDTQSTVFKDEDLPAVFGELAPNYDAVDGSQRT